MRDDDKKPDAPRELSEPIEFTVCKLANKDARLAEAFRIVCHNMLCNIDDPRRPLVHESAEFRLIDKSAYAAKCEELSALDKVYRMNRDWIADAKEQLAAAQAEVERLKAEFSMSEPEKDGFSKDDIVLLLRARVAELEAKVARLREALEKIADPRKRDHKEPDAYTTLGCVMHIAQQALEEAEGG